MNVNILSIILGIAAAAVSGVVGSFALMKRMTLAGDVVSHLTLPGLGIAFLWGWNPLIGAAATLAIGILIIHQLQGRSGLATESAIGVVFVGALAVGTSLHQPRICWMHCSEGSSRSRRSAFSSAWMPAPRC